MGDDKTVKIIDYIILFFSFLFLGSLTNSIFVNQLGYYFALLFVLIRWFYTRKNPFVKTGLELPFILFIAVEVISTLLSYNTEQATTNLIKRVLLLPVVYFITASTTDVKRIKFFFNTYITFAFISALIYLINAYDYFIKGLFQITGSGPGIFQYPITTSILASFTIIFLFAFLIHEKRNWKYKLLIFLTFAVSTLAILATYKRTGWLGLAAGIGFVILMKRKWVYILPLVIIVIAAFFAEKNYSNVRFFNFDGNEIKLQTILNTEGRAHSVTKIDDEIYISDYEGGLAQLNNNKQLDYIKQTPSPVLDFQRVNDSLFSAWLVDTRFMIFKSDRNRFEFSHEFMSPGFTEDYKLYNEIVYAIDKDSGLTVIDALSGDYLYRENLKNPYYKLVVNDSLLALRSRDNLIKIYSLKKGIPATLNYHQQFARKIHIHWLEGGTLLMQGEQKFHKIENARASVVADNNIDPIIHIAKRKTNFYAIDIANKFVRLNFDNGKLTTDKLGLLKSLPNDFELLEDMLITTTYKQGRLTSIFDPYLRSNFVRLSLWKAGWEMFLDHPLFGVGDIDLAELYVKYKSPYAKEIQGHLHNNYIHILAILGITGFVVIMWLLGKIFILNMKIYQTFRDKEFLGSLALGSAGCFVSFLVSGLTEWNFGDHEIITMIWFITGLNFSMYLRRKTEKAD
ncbi:MAG: hypothetical protein SCALA702_29420 [Melioribacteraceae bacterium]|nr:MAG: hypothetical protein SCALA702_29420 [Melioribacteraceae bacterium]